MQLIRMDALTRIPRQVALLVLGAAALLSVGATVRPAVAEEPLPVDSIHADELVLSVQRDGHSYTVRVTFLFAGNDDDSGRREAEGVIRARFEENAAGPAGSSTFNGNTWPGATTSWSYNATGQPATLTAGKAIVAAAADTWNAAGAFRFTGGDATTAVAGACHGATDGKNTIAWGPQTGTVLAVTCGWYANGVATEFDMEIDPEWAWTTGAAATIDFQSVVTHELGHALGLGHSSVTTAVMAGTYEPGTIRRELTADDRAAVEALYGAVPVDAPAATMSTLWRIAPGANLLTWSGSETSPTAALAPIASSLSVVYAYDAGSGLWLRYLPGSPAYVSNLVALHTGMPYWVIAREAATLPVSP